jgi:hypothetical protein
VELPLHIEICCSIFVRGPLICTLKTLISTMIWSVEGLIQGSKSGVPAQEDCVVQDMAGGNLTVWPEGESPAMIRIRENLSVSFKGNQPHR